MNEVTVRIQQRVGDQDRQVEALLKNDEKELPKQIAQLCDALRTHTAGTEKDLHARNKLMELKEVLQDTLRSDPIVRASLEALDHAIAVLGGAA